MAGSCPQPSECAVPVPCGCRGRAVCAFAGAGCTRRAVTRHRTAERERAPGEAESPTSERGLQTMLLTFSGSQSHAFILIQRDRFFFFFFSEDLKSELVDVSLFCCGYFYFLTVVLLNLFILWHWNCHSISVSPFKTFLCVLPSSFYASVLFGSNQN